MPAPPEDPSYTLAVFRFSSFSGVVDGSENCLFFVFLFCRALWSADDRPGYWQPINCVRTNVGLTVVSTVEVDRLNVTKLRHTRGQQVSISEQAREG